MKQTNKKPNPNQTKPKTQPKKDRRVRSQPFLKSMDLHYILIVNLGTYEQNYAHC